MLSDRFPLSQHRHHLSLFYQHHHHLYFFYEHHHHHHHRHIYFKIPKILKLFPHHGPFGGVLSKACFCVHIVRDVKRGFIQGFGLGGGRQKRGLLVWLEWGVGEVVRGAGVKRGVYSSPLYPSISTARAPGVKLRGGQRDDSAICKSQSLRQMYLYMKSICTSQSLKPLRYLYLSITAPLSASIYF